VNLRLVSVCNSFSDEPLHNAIFMSNKGVRNMGMRIKAIEQNPKQIKQINKG